MKKYIILVLLILPLLSNAQPEDYVWTSQSKNSSESMPCGGHDVGMNVWVENGDILFYVCRSGGFDENNTLLKQGRFRLSIDNVKSNKSLEFSQRLSFKDGHLIVNLNDASVDLWTDVFKPVIHLEVNGRKASSIKLSYESWRYKDRLLTKGEGQQSSYKWAVPNETYTKKDSIIAGRNSIIFYHHNSDKTVFDVAANQQGLSAESSKMYNPIKGLIFGGRLSGNNIEFESKQNGVYADTDYMAWNFKSLKKSTKHNIQIALYSTQKGIDDWKSGLRETENSVNIKADKKKSSEWWSNLWNRSYVYADGEPSSIIRNYNLFRYMFACNAYSVWPTKFNGGLFTFDPCFVDAKSKFTPDYRKWGGGTMTAQNQRLVYWPMLKNGDYDMMSSLFNFYLRILPTAELRSQKYWGHKGGCFVEQIENFGLPNPAEYGFKRPAYFDKGVEYNAWLEYEWDTVLEICQMILDTKEYNGNDIDKYKPLIESVLTFFDEHYRLEAAKRGRKDLDGNGKLIIYPGSCCETYKMAYNPASTIAGLRKVLETYCEKKDMLERVPEIPLRTVDSKTMISPAVTWARVNNIETPQLYPVFPWRIYGIGRKDLEFARNTYLYDSDAIKFRETKGWKQDNIWAACLGLTDEAKRLNSLKMHDGPYRFPAFWGPGYDWSPDHNWGGSGMIGIQEMLIQEVDNKIILFPAWPKEWNVKFKLHLSGNTIVEAEMKSGKPIIHSVCPKNRLKDVVTDVSAILMK